MPPKNTDFSEADFKKEVNKILKSMNVPLDPDGNYPDEVKELWPAIQSKLGKKLLAKNWRVWTTMWTNVIGPTYVSAAKEAAKAAGVKYTGEIGAFAKKYHRDHGLALCKTLTETDLQRVQDQIVDNWGIGEKAFEKKFQDDYIGSEARLKTIYRSEHARAISEGTLEVGQEVGHQYKQWWCAEDERSCEICMAHHEETVPMDEAFSGGFAIPQDSHPSCRCVLITLEESDLSDDQKARMASRDPISLDDLDPTFQNSPWKSNEAFRQVLNYKCEFNGTDWKCPDSIPNDTSNDVHNGKHNTLKGSLTNINDIKKPYLEASRKLFEEWGSGPMLEWDPDNIPDKSDPLYSEYKIEEEKYSKLLKQYESERKKVEELAPPIHNGALWQYHRNSYAFNKPEELKTEKEKRDTRLLEETLNAVETKLPIVLWRGEHKDKWDQLAGSKNLETDEFVSLTEEKGIAEQFKDSKGTHLIRWELPPKSHAFPIWNQVGDLENVHEREWVLNKGSKIEVTGKFGNILNVKVIPDNKKQNSIKLNYKCPENSHGPGFSCGGEGSESRDDQSESVDSEHIEGKPGVKQKQNSNDFLKAAVQSAFEIALKTDASKIKFNWNCKDEEKTGSGPGSCKDADNSNTKSEKSNKNPKSSSKPVKVGTYAKIYANKSPKAFPNQLYIVRMGEEDESQYNTKGNQFYGTDLDQLIQKALDSSKDSGRLIIGRVGKNKLDDNDLKDALNNNLEINPGYLSSMVAPVDTVIDTASGDTIYKRSQEELDEEHAKYIESEEFDKQLNQNTAISEYRNFGYQSINTVLRGSYVTDKSQKTSILDSRDVIPEDVVIKTKERIAHIHEAMVPLPKGTTLYRVDGGALTATLFESLGITKELNAKFSESGNNRPKTEDVQQNAAYWNKYLTDKLKDSEFQDLGFSSTSKGRAHISNDLLVPTTELSPYGMPSLLEISTPKGTRSIDVQERVGVGEGRYKEEKEVILDSGTKFKVKSVEFKFRGNEMYTHIKVDALQDQIEEKQNSIQKITQTAFEAALKLGINKIKFNANCPESEKVGTGPGSCGGKNIAEKNSRVSSKLPPISTKFAKELSEDESDSLRSYSTDSYSYISAYLNNKNVSDASGSTFTSSNKELTLLAGYIERLNFNEDKVKEKIYHIDNAMKKSKTELDGIVYSGLGKEKNALVANLKVGDTTTFKGYTSASKRLNVTGFFVPQGLEKNIVLKIRVPKGTNAIDMEKFANQENRKQYEVLLHKGITYKKVGEKEGSVSYRGTKIPVSIVEVEVTNPIDDSPRIDWKPDTMTSSEHKKEYDNSWKSAYDSVENGMKSITIPEKMADPFRRYKTRTISVGDEIEYTPDMYSESKTSKIVGFKPTTEKTPNGKIAYKVDAIIESGESVDLSKHKLRKERNGLKQNSIESIAQKAFEIALKSGSSSIKLNWNCKDSEKNGTGPGSCKDADDSKDTESSSKKSKLPNNTVRIQKYAKILQSKVPDKHESQVYLVRMGGPREDKDHIDDVNGTVFAGHDKQKLIELALKSSKDSGNLIVGRITKDAFYKEELDQIEKDGHVIASASYLGQSSAPVDVVIDTATSETTYRRAQDELSSESVKFKEEEEFKIRAEQNTALDSYRNFGYQSINNVLRGNYVTDKSQKKDYTDVREVYDEKVVEKAKQAAIYISSAMKPSEKSMTLHRVDGGAVTATLFESLEITKELQEYFKQNNIPYGSVKAEQILLWNMEGGLKAPNGSSWDSYLTDKLKDTEFRDPAFSSTSKSESGIKKDLLVPSRDLSAYGVTGLLEIHAPKGTKSIDMQERLGEGEGRYKTEREVLLDKNTIYKIKSVKIEPGDGGIYARIKVDAIQKDEPKENGFLKSIVQKVFESALQSGATKIKFNANCPESEKVGSGPGSCGGKQSKGSFELSKKSEQLLKKYKAKGELKKAKTSIMASLVKSTKDPKTSLENAKINVSIFKGMTAEEADELTGDAAQEHTNWLMDKGPYYDIKQGISEPMLEDTEELHRRGWNVNGTYHPDIPKKSILADAAAKIFTYKDEQGRFRKNAELIDAIEEYTGDLYDMYNKVSVGNLPREFLKLTPEDQKELKDRIDNFAAALNTAELPEPVVTYRGIRETTLKRLEQIGASEIGSEFQVNYFQSTTLNYETTKSFMGKDSKGRSLRVQIKLPKGTPAAYVDGFSANNGEDEVLVNRNLKYRCIDVKETDATKTLVWEAIL